MSLGDIFEKIKQVFTGEPAEEQGNVRPASEDPMGDPADQEYGDNGPTRRYAQEERQSDVQPASRDPYGDPADQYSNVLPASQDPQGDPADQSDVQQGVRPASEDPLGDPADH
jgi:hypothetical protein